jgi:hypothetical protein
VTLLNLDTRSSDINPTLSVHKVMELMRKTSLGMRKPGSLRTHVLHFKNCICPRTITGRLQPLYTLYGRFRVLHAYSFPPLTSTSASLSKSLPVLALAAQHVLVVKNSETRLSSPPL